MNERVDKPRDIVERDCCSQHYNKLITRAKDPNKNAAQSGGCGLKPVDETFHLHFSFLI
jgi:hypothetical protein